MNQHQILYPLVAMLVLTGVVVVLMLRERVAEMRARRIHPQKVSTSTQMSAVLQNTRAADNYRNLFEMPVFFYVLLVALLSLQLVTPAFLGLAWLYVALRVVHTVIHVGYNKVKHRFVAFSLSAVVLITMWLMLLLTLLQRS